MLFRYYSLLVVLTILQTVYGAGTLSGIIRRANKTEVQLSGDKPGLGTQMTRHSSKGSHMSKEEIANYIRLLKHRFEVLGVSLDNYFTRGQTTDTTGLVNCLTNEPETPDSNIPAILAQLQEFISIESTPEYPTGSDTHDPQDVDTGHSSDLDKLKMEVSEFFLYNPKVIDMFGEEGWTAENVKDSKTTGAIDVPHDIAESTLISETDQPTLIPEPFFDYPFFIAPFLLRKFRGRDPSKHKIMGVILQSPNVKKILSKMAQYSEESKHRQRRSSRSRRRSSRRRNRKNRKIRKQVETVIREEKRQEPKRKQCILRTKTRTNDTINLNNNTVKVEVYNNTDNAKTNNSTDNVTTNISGVEIGNDTTEYYSTTQSMNDRIEFNSIEKIKSTRKYKKHWLKHKTASSQKSSGAQTIVNSRETSVENTSSEEYSSVNDSDSDENRSESASNEIVTDESNGEY